MEVKESLKTVVDNPALQQSLESFIELSQKFSTYVGPKATFSQMRFFKLALKARLYNICAAIDLLLDVVPEEEISTVMSNFYDIIRDSSFIRRCHDTPLGYVGDYITINQVLNTKNQSEQYTFGHEIEDVIIKSNLAQQHRNKILYEVHLILNCLAEKDNPSILCLSVAECTHLQKVLKQMEHKNFTLLLHDTNEQAIELAKKNLQPIADRCEFHVGNFLRFVRKDIADRKFDLVTMGGIMDYVSDKAFVAVLKPLYARLPEGGCIYITQVSSENTEQSLMRVVLMWEIIQRTKETIEEVLALADIPKEKTRIVKEDMGITYLVEIYK